jgi:hypothetical protein
MNLFEQLQYIKENMPEAWEYLRDSQPRGNTPQAPKFDDNDEVVDWGK